MITLLAALAHADVCATDTTAFATGPVALTYEDAELGAPHRLCPRTEVGLLPGGQAIVEATNFYGHIVAGATLHGSWAMDDKTELFAGIEAFRYDSVIAPISVDYMGFGHVNVGASRRLWDHDTLGVGAHARVAFPTAFGLYENAWPFGVDLGASGLWAPTKAVRVHADVGGLFSAAASAGPAYPRVGARVVVGAELQPVRPIGLTADLVSGFGYEGPVDSVSAAVAIRAGIGKRVGLQLGAMLPFAGRERALAAGGLGIDVRLGPVE